MPSDEFLVAGLRGGDQAALRVLMDRYDRLVRFAIFRLSKIECRRDPQWLETIAADTWMGFVGSLRRLPEVTPQSLAAYLTTIARFKVVSALRREKTAHVQFAEPEDWNEVESQNDDTIRFLSELDELNTLRDCVAGLESADQALFGQIEAIMDRRWQEASAALGTSESTLRSRWKRVLESLRNSFRRISGRDFAP